MEQATSSQAATEQPMESLGIAPPKFDWGEADVVSEFRKFKRYTELLLETLKLAEKQKVNYILLWLGQKGVEIYDSWELEDEQVNLALVWEKFASYFEPKSSFRLARFQFRDMIQEREEPISRYLTRLKTQLSKCKYQPAAADDQLIDQLIMGVAHDAVRKRVLEQDPEKLTVDGVVNLIRTHETTAEHMRQLNKPVASAYTIQKSSGKKKLRNQRK